MTDRAQLVEVCDRYVELLTAADADGIMALYAPDCWIEDPVGSERKIGHDAIRAFYETMAELPIQPKMTRIGPACVSGGEAAFQFRIDIDLGGTAIKMTSTDIMTFDDEGRITSMRAFPDREADPDA